MHGTGLAAGSGPLPGPLQRFCRCSCWGQEMAKGLVQVPGWGQGLETGSVWARVTAWPGCLWEVPESGWGLGWDWGVVVWPQGCRPPRLRRLPMPRWPSTRPAVRGPQGLLRLQAMLQPVRMEGDPLLPRPLRGPEAPHKLLSWCDPSWSDAAKCKKQDHVQLGECVSNRYLCCVAVFYVVWWPLHLETFVNLWGATDINVYGPVKAAKSIPSRALCPARQ